MSPALSKKFLNIQANYRAQIQSETCMWYDNNIQSDKLFEKCKTIWIKIKDLKNIELDALPVYHNRHIKSTW